MMESYGFSGSAWPGEGGEEAFESAVYPGKEAPAATGKCKEAFLACDLRYRQLVEMSPDAIFVLLDGGIVYANPAMADLVGAAKPEDLLDMHLEDIACPEYRPMLARRVENCLRFGACNQPVEIKIRRAGGGVADVESRSSPVVINNKKAVQVIFRDITARKAAERQIKNDNRLGTVGRLAGSIAHDFNNILTVILGNISLARHYGADREKAAGIYDEIEAASRQARELTKRLLTFADGGRPVRQPLDIRLFLEKACLRLQDNYGPACRLLVSRSLNPALADEGLLYQAVSNILLNAVQARPEGCSIEISAENAAPADIRKLPLPEGEYVKIAIADNGPGIPEENMERVFEPFFSTRPGGEGLGLSSAYSIVRGHQGMLTVDPAEPHGCVFTLYLPCAEEKDPPGRMTGTAAARRGGGHVLVMDDERALRDMAGEMLRVLGYRAETAADGLEALNLYRRAALDGDPFDAVILDLSVRGGMGGAEALGELLAADPKVRAIVSSGYSHDPVMSDYGKYGFRGCVPKPYDIGQLAAALTALLA